MNTVSKGFITNQASFTIDMGDESTKFIGDTSEDPRLCRTDLELLNPTKIRKGITIT